MEAQQLDQMITILGGAKTENLEYIVKSTGIHMNSREMEQMKMQLDPDNTGDIDQNTLVDYLVNLLSGYNEDLLLNALKRLDGDSDGKIPLEELEYYMKQYGDDISEQELSLLLS